MPQLPDVCRVRHGGAETSEEANRRVTPSKKDRQQSILFLLEIRGTLTLREACAELGLPMNALSGRFTELRDDHGLIRHNGERRDGCAVWVLEPRADEQGQYLLGAGR